MFQHKISSMFLLFFSFEIFGLSFELAFHLFHKWCEAQLRLCVKFFSSSVVVTDAPHMGPQGSQGASNED